MIYKHAALQFGLALVAFSMWAAADSWYLLTGLPLASGLSILTGALAGLAVATVIHEWSHFLGARLAGASYKIPKKFGFFVFDYDFPSNNLSQFNWMSLGGQLGSLATILLLFFSVPLDNPGRAMLLAAAVGSAVFGGMIEWPVIKRSQASGEPMAELSQVTPQVLQRSAVTGIVATLGLWSVIG